MRFGDSAMNHAMAFVGVDVDDDGTTTRRWRVENSWGDKIADKGYFTMSDDWFTEHRPARLGSDGRFGLISNREGPSRLFHEPNRAVMTRRLHPTMQSAGFRIPGPSIMVGCSV